MDLAMRFFRNDLSTFRPAPSGASLWAASIEPDNDSNVQTRMTYAATTGSRQVRPGQISSTVGNPPTPGAPATNTGWRDNSYSHPSQGTLVTRLTGPFTFTYSLGLSLGNILPVTAQLTVVVFAVSTSNATRELFRAVSPNQPIGPNEANLSHSVDPGPLVLQAGEILQYEFYLNVINNPNLTEIVVTFRAGAGGTALSAPSVGGVAIVAVPKVDLSGVVAGSSGITKSNRKRWAGQLSPWARIPGRRSSWDPPEPADPNAPWWSHLLLFLLHYILKWLIGGFSIAGVERTQAIQFFRFNGQGSGAGENNSIPLVARKATVFRVYVAWRAGILKIYTPTSVSGRLYYRDTSVPPLGPSLVLSKSSISRRHANHTLNFRIPAADCHGTIDFSLSAFDPARPTYRSLAERLIVSFQNVPRIRIRGVLVRYTGQGMNIPPPSHAQLVSTHTRPATLYPIEGFNFTGDQEYTFSGNLNTPSGWQQLVTNIATLRSMSSSSDAWVAVIPNSVRQPGGTGYAGIASDGATCVYVDGVLTHELGHVFGRAHAPCGPVGAADPNYPTYPGYPPASIGEFGFSNSDSLVYDPATAEDFMSYCEEWVSPYTYSGLMNATISGSGGPALFAHGGRAASANSSEAHRKHLYIAFRIDDNGECHLLPSFQLQGPVRSRLLAAAEDVRCELRDAAGRTVYTHACVEDLFDVEAERRDREFREAIPLADNATTVAVVSGKQELLLLPLEDDRPPHVRIIARRPPAATIEQKKKDESVSKPYVLEWQVENDDDDVAFTVRYSWDDGRSWVALATAVRSRQLIVDLASLRGGDSCVFQVAASRGVTTTTARTEPFRLQRHARTGYIVPVFSDSDGRPTGLLGAAYSLDYESPPSEDLLWTVDEVVVARGAELHLQHLPRSTRTVTLIFPDGTGNSGKVGYDLAALDRSSSVATRKMAGRNRPNHQQESS